MITDDDIRDLRSTQSPTTGNCAYLCSLALGEQQHPVITQAEAREQCAEILAKRGASR